MCTLLDLLSDYSFPCLAIRTTLFLCFMVMNALFQLEGEGYSKVFFDWTFFMWLIYYYSKLKLWIQEICMQHSDLFIGEQQVWGKLYSQQVHTIATNRRGSSNSQIGCASMDSTFHIAFSINLASTSLKKCQYINVIPHFFRGKTWGRIA